MRYEVYQDQGCQSQIENLLDVFQRGTNVFHHEYRVIAFRFELRRERLYGPAQILRFRKVEITWLLESFLPDTVLILGAIKIHVGVCLEEDIDDFDVSGQSDVHQRQQESDLQGVYAPIDLIQGESPIWNELVGLTQRNSLCNLKILWRQFSLKLT